MAIIRILLSLFRVFRKRGIPGVSASSLTSIASSLLGDKGAQLPALLERLTSGGLGDLVKSWVGTGKNLPLSAKQVRSALDSETLSALAGQLGTSENAAASKVARVLPQLIDRLTPDGAVPDQDALAQGLADLIKK